MPFHHLACLVDQAICFDNALTTVRLTSLDLIEVSVALGR
jgi:hypothetical protein